MPNSLRYEGATLNLADLDQNLIELGIPDDLDGDFVFS